MTAREPMELAVLLLRIHAIVIPNATNTKPKKVTSRRERRKIASTAAAGISIAILQPLTSERLYAV
jgi:hypothetical protein